MRLGHEGDDVRPRPAARGHQQGHGRRRPREHEQRAVFAHQGTSRNAHGPRPGVRPHVPRRPRGRLRQGQADGHVRRGDRRQVRLHARAAGRVRDRVAEARAGRDRVGRLRRRDRAGHAEDPQGRGHGRHRRAASQGQPRQDPDAAPGVPRGRHRDRGQLELDLRRRRRAGADGRGRSRTPRRRTAGGYSRACNARARARVVHDRAGRRA